MYVIAKLIKSQYGDDGISKIYGPYNTKEEAIDICKRFIEHMVSDREYNGIWYFNGPSTSDNNFVFETEIKNGDEFEIYDFYYIVLEVENYEKERGLELSPSLSYVFD